jgi:hypothetical protein
MTDKEAWVRFASAVAADRTISAQTCAEFADSLLEEMHARFPEEPKAEEWHPHEWELENAKQAASVTKEEIHEWIHQQNGSVPSWFCSKCGIRLNASSSANPPATHPHYPCTKGGSHG